MYHEVGIHKLSENQLSKLRNGHPVRVKLGNHHKIHLSIQQLKKLHKASQKGSASTITFDPYQMEAHGSGIFGDIARKAKAFVQKYHLQDVVNPVIHKAKRLGHHAVNQASHYAHSQLNRLQPIEGHGIGTDLGEMALAKMTGLHYPLVGSGMKRGRRSGKGLFGGILSGASGLSNLIGGPGSDEASKVLGTIGGIANTLGLGVVRKHHTPHTRKKRITKGKGFVEDLGAIAKSAGKEMANKGIEFGADYLKNKVSGMGTKRFAPNRRIVGRKSAHKKSFGGSGCGGYGKSGSLYPAGAYEGTSLFPA